MAYGIATIEHDGYTLTAFSSLYLDFGLSIVRGEEELFYNPSCLSRESYGVTWETEDGRELDEGIEWTEEQWQECLRSEADTFIEAYCPRDEQ